MASDLQIKQVLVYRRDLKMRKGKIAAQCAHASMKVFLDRGSLEVSVDPEGNLPDEHWMDLPLTPEMAAWVGGLFGKIVLSVDSEEDLLRVYKMALDAGIPAALVTDAGRTEFKKTCPKCKGSGTCENPYLAAPCHQCGGKGKVGVPTNTTVGLGPALASEIDKITGPEGAVPTRLP